jgi:dolichyl-phosphate-mannose--protein O-mannosyl transferase
MLIAKMSLTVPSQIKESLRHRKCVPIGDIMVNFLLMTRVYSVNSNNTVFWDVMQFGSYKNRRFRGTYRQHHHGDKNRRARNNVSTN